MNINEELEKRSFRLNSKTEQQILQMYNEDIVKLNETKKIVGQLDALVIPKIAVEKLYRDLCNQADIFYNKAIKQEQQSELQTIYDNRYIGLYTACKWIKNLLAKYDSNFSV